MTSFTNEDRRRPSRTKVIQRRVTKKRGPHLEVKELLGLNTTEKAASTFGLSPPPPPPSPSNPLRTWQHEVCNEALIPVLTGPIKAEGREAGEVASSEPLTVCVLLSK